MPRFPTIVLLVALGSALSMGQMIGINVLLDAPPDAGILAAAGSYGTVLDVIPEINAIRVRAHASDLDAIRALPHVVSAQVDGLSYLTSVDVPMPDYSAGTSLWNLDAINVTNHGTGRTVPYDGDGVYVAVVDSGLPHNWREYFPEERIASELAVTFGGGASESGNISTQPEKWQNSTNGHGTWITSVLLGFSYYGTQIFNGVAPRAKVIPVRTFGNDHVTPASVNTLAILYVTNLKTSGALGTSPVVMNLSFGGADADAMQRAAIDFAVAQGIVVVAGAGNEGTGGMLYPASFPEVISVGAAGYARQLPPDDPTAIWWILRDVLENDPLELFVWEGSSRPLPGQDLDLVAPGVWIPAAHTRAGQPDYTFVIGTSHACPHAAGVAALMLQKNPVLGQSQVETILEATAMPLAPGCRSITDVGVGPGNPPTWSDLSNVFFFPATTCWGADATGSGLLQADAALMATPLP